MPLSRGNMVLARTFSSQKVHIVTFQNYKNDDHSTNLFSAYPICQMDSRYYWEKPWFDDLGALVDPDEVKCRRCFAGWRARGSFSVIGLADDKTLLTEHPRLAFAWKEVPPVGHPKDGGRPPPKEGEKEERRDADEYARKEVRRFVRGRRYVRLCQFTEGDYPYGVFVGYVDGKDKLRYRAQLGKCLRKITEITAGGGDT